MTFTQRITRGISILSLVTAFGGATAFAQAILGPDLTEKMETAGPADMRGHVQLALDLQLIRASFEMEQGPFDLTPTVTATFSPEANVTRSEYAFSAVNLFDRMSQAAE